MPAPFSLLRRAARVCALVGAASGLIATSASAGTATFEANCRYFAPGYPVEAQLSVSAFVSDRVRPGEPLPGAELALGSTHRTLAEGYVSNYFLGARKLTGTATVGLRVTETSGATRTFATQVALDDAKPQAGPTGLYGVGATPSLPLQDDATLEVERVDFNITPLDREGRPVRYGGPDIEPDSPPDSDGNPDTFDVSCAPGPTQDLAVGTIRVEEGVFETCDLGRECPVPAPARDVRVGGITAGTATLAWNRAAGFFDHPTPAYAYVIAIAGRDDMVTSARSVALTGLAPRTTYTGTIRTTYRYSLAPSTAVPFAFTTAEEPAPPTSPDVLPPRGDESGPDSVTLEWVPSRQNDGPSVAYYRLLVEPGGEVRIPADQIAYTLRGLEPDREYRLRLSAVDFDGRESTSYWLVRKTLPAPSQAPVGLALTGSISLKTLTKGALPVRGSLNGTAEAESGAFTGDLALADTSGRLTTLGFLPLTAKIGFVATGETIGTIDGEGASLESKVRLKVREVRLFGAIPLVSGNGCQTKQLTTLSLRSTGAFSPTAGGTLGGTFTLSDLNGCGAFNGLVSPLVAGGGNALTVALAPRS